MGDAAVAIPAVTTQIMGGNIGYGFGMATDAIGLDDLSRRWMCPDGDRGDAGAEVIHIMQA